MIFAKRVKTIQWGKDKWQWEKWISTCKRMKLDPYLTPHTKITPKWIKIVNIKPSTIKLLEENIVKKLNDIGFEKDFLDMISKA